VRWIGKGRVNQIADRFQKLKRSSFLAQNKKRTRFINQRLMEMNKINKLASIAK